MNYQAQKKNQVNNRKRKDAVSVRTDRRDFLKLSAGSVAALGLVGVGAQLTGCSSADEPVAARHLFLRDQDVALFAALIPVVLDGALPADVDERHATITEIISSIDQGIVPLGLPTRGAVFQLFDLLHMRVTRFATTGVWAQWADASHQDIDAFLTRWQHSSIGLFNSGYRALTQLIMIRYFSLEQSWQFSGYSGPQPWAVKALES